MNDLLKTMPVIYLNPGENHFTNKPKLIKTVLGSCISVIIYNRASKYSAFTHSVMPEKNCRENSCICCEPKFVDCSIRMVLTKFDELRIKRNELECKLFGGSEINNIKTNQSLVSIGTQNLKTAKKILLENNIPIISSDIGGLNGRKIIYNTITFEVFVKKLNNTKNVELP